MDYEITEQDVKTVARNFFRDGHLTTLPARQKAKEALMPTIAARFAPDRVYTETEVNETLAPIYDDYTTLRRHLVDMGYLLRDSRGVEYRRSEKPLLGQGD